jgi:alkaline phosphatase D
MHRRQFVRTVGVSALGAMVAPARVFGQAPAIVTSDAMRPQMPFGIASGDVDAGPGGARAVIWSRADRPARMLVEYATTESFTDARRLTGPAALEEWDYTSRLALTGLPGGQTIHYRVQFLDLGDLRTLSAPLTGRFRTPDIGDRPTRDVTLAWSADTCGQGWGIDAARGGLRLYDVMRRVEPDVFVHCGDTIYADQPLQAEVTLDDGTRWRNLVTPEKSKVAETLDEFRGQYRYNLLDEHMRRFQAEVPTLAIWDDHEVRDNFYDTRPLDQDARYAEKRMTVLIARARRAFLDYQPLTIDADDPERIFRTRSHGPLLDVIGWDMRSYRGANSTNRQPVAGPDTALLGPGQLAWVKARLKASRATWKVIASDMPLGLVVVDFPVRDRFEAVANAENGPPLGRELEIADLLAFIKRERIRNVVFVTGDVHYCAAHRYDPARAAFTDFDPFWEFVAGPLHAGTFGPNALDTTFGPEVKFVGIPPGMKPGRSPAEGFQFFGTVKVDAKTRAATVGLHNLAGETIYRQELAPA